MDILVYENEDVFLDFPLFYGQQYSVTAKRGLPVPRADTSAIYFYVAATISSSPYLSLTDASSTQIEWLDTTTGKIRVHLGSNTNGHVGDNQVYEVRIKMADGTYITLDTGTIHIKPSIVDRP